MLFNMLWFILILFGVFSRNHFLILHQRIRSFQAEIFIADTSSTMDHTMWKNMKNCAWKSHLKLCTFSFEATCAFGKMCSHFLVLVEAKMPPNRCHHIPIRKCWLVLRDKKLHILNTTHTLRSILLCSPSEYIVFSNSLYSRLEGITTCRQHTICHI